MIPFDLRGKMITFLIVLFVIFSLFLALFILIQPGKGDMGLGGMSQQMLFGGSGGQSFFQKTTWALVAVFIFGALGLAILKSYETKSSLLHGFKVEKQQPVSQVTTKRIGGFPEPITPVIPVQSKKADVPTKQAAQ
jgi:protein translocase SecG subunit